MPPPVKSSTVYDPRVVVDKPTFPVVLGSPSIITTRILNTNASQQTINWGQPLPGAGQAFLNRTVRMEVELQLKFDAVLDATATGMPRILWNSDGVTGAGGASQAAGPPLPVVPTGNAGVMCPADYPMHALINSANVTVNSQQLTMPYQIVQRPLRMAIDTPDTREWVPTQTAQPRFADNAAGLGCNSSPMAGLAETMDQVIAGNSMWANWYFTDPNGEPLFGGSPAAPKSYNAAPVGGGAEVRVYYENGIPRLSRQFWNGTVAPFTTDLTPANVALANPLTTFPIFIKMETSEPLQFPPLTFTGKTEYTQQGIANLLQLNVLLTLTTPAAARLFLEANRAGWTPYSAPAPPALPAYLPLIRNLTWANDGIAGGKAALLVQTLSPNVNVPPPLETTLPMTYWSNTPQTYSSPLGPVTKQLRVQTPLAQPSVVPNAIIVWAAPSFPSAYPVGSSNFMFTLSNVELFWNNLPTQANTLTPRQLWSLTRKNGFEMPYPTFAGFVRGPSWMGYPAAAQNSADATNIAGAYPSCVATSGCPVVFVPGDDFSPGGVSAPGVLEQGNYYIKMDVFNQTNSTIGLWIVNVTTVTAGFITFGGVSAVQQQGVFTLEEVARIQPPGGDEVPVTTAEVSAATEGPSAGSGSRFLDRTGGAINWGKWLDRAKTLGAVAKGGYDAYKAYRAAQMPAAMDSGNKGETAGSGRSRLLQYAR